ncbi:DNA cytosine methyltransferase [Nocardia cyriacigeorgica]|uniref:DNA (cytosine-5-)-methyltransferase n=1 Tax=Nocardia cyriacigeorgica TaxID=135487 RepID=A0ABX0CGR8_9NOCA|nr:DNA cytosine methyltransferase [Nocardia cyriacigeorgica]NEW42751.1 DNA cytosine methyltransferase [Nocardia cyriacigeorgica]NEW53954.1 DNA cytosine methyltransferase [Nocardia cyriacigeorgica]NEW54457.1 DNA cytosine methyltransferase [Nocardia cyriacigeorgica]
MPELRIGSLFSGAGGLDLAALELFPGSSMAWHCEIDPAASRVLAHHWPDVPNLGSVTDIDWHTVDPVDVLTGGFPCQDVSAAGRRAGLSDGTRSGLWSHMATAIDVLRPRCVLIENVRGLLSATAIRRVESDDADMGHMGSRSILRALGAVLGDLADLGFDAEWTCVRASQVGACHRRERVFVLAYPADTPRGGWESVDDSTSGETACRGGNGIAGRGARRDAGPVALLPTPRASDGTKGGPNQRGSSGDLMLPSAVAALLPTPKRSDADRGDCPSERARRSPSLVSIDRYLPTPSASENTGGGVHPDKRVGHTRQLIDYALVHGTPQWGDYEPAIRRQEALSRPAPPPTEPNRKGNPRLNAAFAEWLMFWPAGWVTDPAIGLSRNEQLARIGNGVVPRQAVAAFRYLLTAADLKETAHA